MDDLIKLLQNLMANKPRPKGGIADTPQGVEFLGTKLTKKQLAEYEGVVGRRPAYKIAVKESDWGTYWGSNKLLKELLKTESKDNFEKCILICVPTKKLLTYYELKYQILYEVLEKPDEFFNDNILGKFFTKDFD